MVTCTAALNNPLPAMNGKLTNTHPTGGFDCSLERATLEGDKTKKYQTGKFLVNPITFDNNCPYGFIQTEQWLLLQYKRKALIKAELELDKARKELLSDTDRLKVYRKWETRFKNKKLPEAEAMFYHGNGKHPTTMGIANNVLLLQTTTLLPKNKRPKT